MKSGGYHSRFQTPFRRRRECKTDYVQRTSLIQQDKTKYGARKYRLVARITNTKVIAQIIYAELDHDVTLAQATSAELPRYGVKLGLTNYAAAYCVGLLLGRRVLNQLGLAEKFKSEVKPTDDDDAQRPFKVILDVGLRRTTTGARVFAVMKGVVDAGVFVPHDDTRFAGFVKAGKKEEKKKGKVDNAANLRRFLLGGHVADYMKKLQAENPEKYQRQFGRYVREGIQPGQLAGIYEAAHKAIRADPAPKEKVTTHYRLPKPQTPKMSAGEKRAILNAKLLRAGLAPKPDIGLS